MTAPPLSTLFPRSTLAEIFDLGIAVARKLGLPVGSWQDGDPTKSMYYFLSEYLNSFEEIAQGYVASGFLGLARALAEQDDGYYPWLVRTAYEGYAYEAREATFATVRMTLTNAAGGLYTVDDLAPGNISYENTQNGATYTSTSGPEDADGNPVPLRPVSAAPANVVYQWVTADQAGSDSSADPAEIGLLGTSLPGVTATNETAAIGTDKETPASVEQGAREKLGPMSSNGPGDAYNSVARDPDKTGTTGITRARTYTDSTTGQVRVYLAGPSGAVSSEDVAAAEAAIVLWATPGCTTPIVSSAVNKTINGSWELWLYDNIGQTSDEVIQTVEAALRRFFEARPIGGDLIEAEGIGKVYMTGIESAISGAFARQHFIRLRLVTPAVDTPLTEQEVPVFGTFTPLGINFEPRASA
jgi:hypothetical protein